MRQLTWFISIGFLILVSCRTARDGEIYQQINQDKVQVGIIDDSLLNVEIAYIGAMGHSYIFECTIENKTDNMVVIDKSQFSMDFNDHLSLKPVEEDQIVTELVDNRSTLKKRKKSGTILNGVLIGIGVLASATAGLNAGEVIAYSAESIFAVFDERRWYQLNIESVEDEIEYIRSAQFHSYQLLPEGLVTRDILFPTTRVKTNVNIVFSLDEHDFIITFPKKIFR